MTSVLAIVTKGDGADDEGVGVWEVEVEEVVIDVLFVQQDGVVCVVNILVGLVIFMGYDLFESLVDIGFLMTGDKGGRPVLLTLIFM